MFWFLFHTTKHRILGMLKKQEDADGVKRILEVIPQEPIPEGPSCSKLCWPSSLHPSDSPKHPHLPGHTQKILFIASIERKSEGATSFSTSLCKIPARNKLWAFPAQEPAPVLPCLPLLPKSLQLEFKDKIHGSSLALADAELLQNTLKTQFSAEEYSELQRQWGMRQEGEAGRGKGRKTLIKMKSLETQPLSRAYFVYSFFKFHVYTLLCLSWNCTSQSSFKSFD